MLRAIAGYFFGDIQDETPEAPVECETREVNDWLVVNLPDHCEDGVDLNDDVGANSVDFDHVSDAENGDFDDENDANSDMDLDEDDILLSLSVLWTPEEHFEPIHDESYDEEEEGFQNLFSSTTEEGALPQSNILLPLPWLDSERRLIAQELCRIKGLTKNYDWCLATLRFQTLKEYAFASMMCNNRVAILNPPEIKKDAKKEKTVADIIKEKNTRQTKFYKHPDVTCHPMYSKNYVNHRHPALPPKTDLQQRIQELEPVQRVIQRVIKKNITKGQLNRQNKNYIYETSTKKNRRSNLQRNHSGANNNRKC